MHAAKGKYRGDRAKEQSKLATKKGVREGCACIRAKRSHGVTRATQYGSSKSGAVMQRHTRKHLHNGGMASQVNQREQTKRVTQGQQETHSKRGANKIASSRDTRKKNKRNRQEQQ